MWTSFSFSHIRTYQELLMTQTTSVNYFYNSNSNKPEFFRGIGTSTSKSKAEAPQSSKVLDSCEEV